MQTPNLNRNEPCFCGSGKRFKHCHGRIESTGSDALRLEAQAAHRSGALARAEALYRQALEADPADVHALHMLGVLQFERMRMGEALDLLSRAAERTAWADPTIRQNMGFVLAHLLSPQANARQEALVAAYLDRERARRAEPAPAAAVSVVLPVYNQADVIARAIASVAAQTYANIELVVVDDGSTDGTAAEVARCLADVGFAARLVEQEHRGAAHAGNAGAERAEGRYLAFLGAGDWFAPDRVERMVAEIARATPLWGFSRVARTDDRGGSDHDGGDAGPARGTASRSRDFLGHEPASFTLLTRDVIGPAGNLFIDRGLFRELLGFRDVRSHRGWEFALRAARAVEPVALDQPLYFRGADDRDRIAGQPGVAQSAAELLATRQVADALSGDTTATNEFCPQFAANRDLLLRAELRAGRGDRIPVPLLRSLAGTWHARATAEAPRPPGAAGPREPTGPGQARRTALVVLGIYRSGTSALSRVLNLCGAFLPQRVVAARLGTNPKGFWESEAVNHLDARLLRHLGADWSRIDFALPREGPLVDDFLADSRELLASEYGDAPFILIKDPRICILAPLWHRALEESGYRPVYVVPVRNPLEVARSLEAQGDLPAAEGLALWLAYMERIEAFVRTVDAPVVHLRYTELLDDWRRVVRRIARHLDVPLAIDRRAAEIDAFIEAGMRKHRAADAELDEQLAGASGDALRTMYRRMLERCERDAAAQLARTDHGSA
ncbi:MAG: glycosyltransferase [Candidatus Levyibacteriota bacterium]